MKAKALEVLEEMKAIAETTINGWHYISFVLGNHEEALKKAEDILHKHGFVDTDSHDYSELRLYDRYYVYSKEDTGNITISLSSTYHTRSSEQDEDMIIDDVYVSMLTVTDEDGNEENLI